MKQKLDKLKFKIKTNNKIIIFLLALTIIGIISGTTFSLIISAEDKIIVSEYLNSFLQSIKSNSLNQIDALKNSIIDNFSITLVIWLFGISIIGIPINLSYIL